MMKPVSEQPAQARVLGLVDVIVRDRGIRLGDTQAILEGVSGIAASAFPAHLLHGKRAEAMFGYVLAELDQCRLIKEEDAGETLAREDATLAIPDYRIVTKDGRMLLIEVKNVHGADGTAALTMRPDYAAALRTYGDLNHCPVLVAVYWSRWGVWTLVTLDDLKPDGSRLQLTFPDAIVANRMGEVGDHSIGIRTPLRLRLMCEPVQLSVGQPDVRFRVQAVEIYCGETLLVSPEEQRVAFFLMLFGRWRGPSEAITNDRLVMTAVEFTAAPDEPMTPKQGFDIVGSASELLTDAYRHATVSADGAIDRLRPATLPVPITGVLPSDFRSDSMPVWRFTQVQNDAGAQATSTNIARGESPTRQRQVEPRMAEPERFLYFAYGSNMLTRRLRAANRTPSALPQTIGYVERHRLTFDKLSKGRHKNSGKCDMHRTGIATDRVWGVLFSIIKAEEDALDAAEGVDKGYRKDREVDVVTGAGLKVATAYIATDKDASVKPYHWYKAFVVAGAVEHELPRAYIEWLRTFESQPDSDGQRRAENEALLFEPEAVEEDGGVG